MPMTGSYELTDIRCRTTGSYELTDTVLNDSRYY